MISCFSGCKILAALEKGGLASLMLKVSRRRLLADHHARRPPGVCELEIHCIESILISTDVCLQLVIVSPLMRTCETACGVFGGASAGSQDAKLLMKRQDDARLERSAHDAIALPANLPFLSEELVRERMGGSRMSCV